jgi:hypothetical protein
MRVALSHPSILLDLIMARILIEDNRILEVEEILDQRKHTWKIHMIKVDHRPLQEILKCQSKIRELKKFQMVRMESSQHLNPNPKEVEEWLQWLIILF